MSTVIRNDSHLVPIDQLDEAIVNLASRINQSTYELLVLVRQFDERVGWLKWGFESCADWLHWRCDFSMSTAREKVRVAHALKCQPCVAAAFASGTLSYSKARLLARVVTPANEKQLVRFAEKTTTARVAARCIELRYGTAGSGDEANRAFAVRSLRIHRDRERGIMTFTVELPVETGELLEKAIDRARDETACETPELVDDRWSAQQADGIVAMANAYLAGNGDTSAATADNYNVTVHVDQAALTNGEGRSGLPLESVKRLCCDGDAVVIVEDDNGEPLSVGRKTRTVPTAIKRALKARDGGCSFPGCKNKRFVDAHHIQHWSAGGETSMDNLMLLCSRHHRLVHEGGYRIEHDYRNRWFFKRPDGIAVPACGYRPGDMVDDDIEEFSTSPNNPPRGGSGVNQAFGNVTPVWPWYLPPRSL